MTGVHASSKLPGVYYGSRQAIADERGSFRELWRASAPELDGLTFVQGNLSTSATAVLRGLHLHRRQTDLWVVVSGRAFVALVDVRPVVDGRSEQPSVETRELGAGDCVVIPPGVAHGFLALEPVQLMYQVTNEYDGTDEYGFAWDDAAVAVPWPRAPGTADGRPITSDRDRTNPPLADLVRRLRELRA